MARIWELAERWIRERPDAEFIVFGQDRLTWREFGVQVDSAARGLLALGIEPGERIAMLSMARPEFLVTFLAAGKIGAGWLGLSPKYKLAELQYMLDDCRPAVLVAAASAGDEAVLEIAHALQRLCPYLRKVVVIGGCLPDGLTWDEFVPSPEATLDDRLRSRSVAVSETDEALLLYTSGSTGRPKGVIHSHYSLTSNVAVQFRKWGIDTQSRLMLHFPINHAAASVVIGLGTIAGGGALVIEERFDPRKALELTVRERISILNQVPSMFLMQFALPEFSDEHYASVRRFVTAGIAAPKPMMDRLAHICAKTGASVLTGYGLSETCGFATFSADGDTIHSIAIQAGRIAEGYGLRIVDDRRRPVAPGGTGEVALRGPFMMSGYLNRPEDTAAALDAEGWLYTGDLAYQDSTGTLYIVGRKSEMYKTGGENVFPREVEAALEQHPGVAMAAVVKAPDPVFQEVGWAFVVPKADHHPEPHELGAWCQERLANFKVPKRIFVRGELPLLPNGKIDKPALREEVTSILATS